MRRRDKVRRRAVAIKYEPETHNAPHVVAKGEGSIADRIIEIAKEHGIHIHNDPDLVEVLSRLDIDQEIPPYLYVVIAELLAFVYSLNRKKGLR